jgi:cyanophycinase-like exopeptidase
MRADLCLQGGAEFRPGCEPMDAAMLAGPDGAPRRVLVAPFAGAPGREREIAGANAERWYRGLGACDVTVLLEDAELTAALDGAGLLVLPGGSPARLLEALSPHAEALRAALDRGVAVSGASAGAMVLCAATVLPGAPVRAVPALGLAEVDLVLPHYRGSTRWLDAARPVLRPGAVVLGLPERSGVILGPDGQLRAVGVEPFTRLEC